MTFIAKERPINELQESILRLIDRGIPDEDLLEIKDIIVKYLSEKLLDNVDKVIEEKGITEQDFKELENRHYRTKKS
ncbi:hypothetical protein [uncultured Arcticibacterium sp.]|uniref:hypothetical protein n=1 Tax=uncultured Arcticibacterium sp. TaxID=2173042 RepID=UPI0030F720F1